MERLRAAPHQDQTLLQTLPAALPRSNGENAATETKPAPRYNTGIGTLTFEELYKKTSRVVGALMRDVHGMTNPEDIDDCMQAGYLKIWQLLQKDPECFADKPKRYIVQAVLFRSKAQRFSHQRHYNKMLYDADPVQQKSVGLLTTHQVDTWIDLEQALAAVAGQAEDAPASLLGLYCLITQASMRDVADTFGYGYSTLSKKRREARADLAATLEGYGPRAKNGAAATVPTPLPSKPSSGLVTNKLFAALRDPQADELDRRAAPVNGCRKTSLREQIRPFEDPQLMPIAYPTRWGGTLTLEQIINDPQVRRAALAKANRLGLGDEDCQDCVQQGFIKLWQDLKDDPGLLADKGPVWAGIYVAYSGGSKRFHRHHQRQQTFTNPDFDWQDAQEYLDLGRQPHERATHAPWTQAVDERIDVDLFFNTMIQHYAHDPKKEIAFQSVIGAISAQEAAQQLGLDKKNFAASIGNQVRQEVQALLPETMKAAQPESWKIKLARGEGIEHIREVAEEVLDNQRLLLALYVVLTSVTKKEVARTFGYGMTVFGQDISKIKQRIAAKYRRGSRPSLNQRQ